MHIRFTVNAHRHIHICTHWLMHFRLTHIMCRLLLLPACLLGLVTDQEQHLSPLGGDRNYLGVKNWGCNFSFVHWESWQTNWTVLTSTSWITWECMCAFCMWAAKRCVLRSILTESVSYRSLNMLHLLSETASLVQTNSAEHAPFHCSPTIQSNAELEKMFFCCGAANLEACGKLAIILQIKKCGNEEKYSMRLYCYIFCAYLTSFDTTPYRTIPHYIWVVHKTKKTPIGPSVHFLNCLSSSGSQLVLEPKL